MLSGIFCLLISNHAIAFMAISYAKKVAALAGNALTMAGLTPLMKPFGPFVRNISLNAWRYDLNL